MVRDMRCRTPKKDDKVWLTPPENPPVCEVPLRDRAYIKVKCLGRDLCALVDTGASKCLMSMDIYQSLVGRPKLTTSDIPHFRVANNGMLPTCGVTTLPLCIGDQEMAVKLYVVPHLSNEIILGPDHLSAFRAEIDYGRDVVRFDVREGLFTVRDTVLMPREEKVCPCQIAFEAERSNHKCSGFAT